MSHITSLMVAPHGYLNHDLIDENYDFQKQSTAPIKVKPLLFQQEMDSNLNQCEYDEMEVIDSHNDTHCGSIMDGDDIDDGELSSDEDIKSTDSYNGDDGGIHGGIHCIIDHDMDIDHSLAAIGYFSSDLDVNVNGNGNGNQCNLLQINFHHSPLKWCQMINFLIQLHYDMGHPSLKPNIISLTAEYLAYLTNHGHFNKDVFHHTINGGNATNHHYNHHNDINIRKNVLIRMALFEAVKYDQGFQMNTSKLFDLNHYSKPMVFSHNKAMYDQINNGTFKMDQFQVYSDDDEAKDDKEMVEWLRLKEIEFCHKLKWQFAFSTRYQTLMVYLKRLGFNTDCIMSQQYKNVKIAYNEIQTNAKYKYSKIEFSDEIKFGFLCRYLLEMTYYKVDFYSYSKPDLIISVIYAAYIIAQRWTEKFNFNQLMTVNNKHDLYQLLDNKHPKNNETVSNLIKKIIRIGRAPHSCSTYCQPVYVTNPITNNQTHYHLCKCVLNCCLNTYLKFSKIAFCEISKMPCLSTSNINKFVEFMDNPKQSNDTNWTPVIRAFASNQSVLQLSK